MRIFLNEKFLCTKQQYYYHLPLRRTLQGPVILLKTIIRAEHKYFFQRIIREKEIKGWTRKKKWDLISRFNPEVKFLNEELFGGWPPKDNL